MNGGLSRSDGNSLHRPKDGHTSRSEVCPTGREARTEYKAAKGPDVGWKRMEKIKNTTNECCADAILIIVLAHSRAILEVCYLVFAHQCQ